MKQTVQPLVSIVIPVYNAEKYLREMLDSIVNQSYGQLEIICVDDGSTDNSVQIIEDYSRKDNRIRMASQKNLFAGVARNRGLKMATGKYILFLDADDIFELNMISKLVQIAEDKKSDVIIFGHYYFTECIRNRKPYKNMYKNDKVISSDEIADCLFQIVYGVPWNKFLNLEFVRNTELNYQNIPKTNDEFFNKMIVVESSRIVFCKERFVNYRINNKNSLQGNRTKNQLTFSKAIIAIFDELIRREKYQTFKNSFTQYAINICISELSRAKTFDEFMNIVGEIGTNTSHVLTSEFENKKYEYADLVKAIRSKEIDRIIFEFIKYQQKTMISKQSLEVKIGGIFTHLLKL